MKRAGILTRDWFLALLLGLLFLVAVHQQFPLLERLEAVAYDHGVTLSYRAPRSTERAVVLAVDDASIKALGQWPWPRSVLADALSLVAKGHPRVIALDLPLDQPQNSTGLNEVRELQRYVADVNWPKSIARYARVLDARLNQLAVSLDADARLAAAIDKAPNVLVPMRFDFTGATADKPAPAPPYVQQNRLTKINMGENATVLAAQLLRTPIAMLGEKAQGVGFHNSMRDPAGGGRTETLVAQYNGDFYPSLSLLAVARSMGISPRDIAVDYGARVRLGGLSLETDPTMRFFGNFYPNSEDRPAFATYSIHQLLDGKVPPQSFRNRIVVIGVTAADAATTFGSPISATLSAPERTANVITAMLNQDYFRRPFWAGWGDLALVGLIIVYLVVVLPNIGLRWGIVVSAVLVLTLLFAGQYVLLTEKIWLRTVSPALLVVLGHLLIFSRHVMSGMGYATTADSVETNRLLGLAFQGQGQLDMAMDKFRKLPIDHSVLELIYNVALDFERKRQFNKAIAAYDYILNHDGRFRDVRDRKKRAQRAESAVMGGPFGGGNGGTLVISGVDQKPTLGRYQVEREIGKGAMGTVYFGRDPRINRVVAIKTLALNEFEPDEQQKVKDRFFREAETAGRLNHPNIVTIYDVGEEHDLAYIAMEFLQGRDLTHYLDAEEPNDIGWVAEVISQVADALDYAHRQDVVHRDIKPANIMFNEADRSVKVTDFGIARIADSTRTKTGVVLGTPSYMSPEQLAGERVDGRSDLFSLGVMSFELLSGQQPFGGESLAALMYQIANAKHPDVTRLRKGMPSCIRGFFDRALAKKPKKRFQSGEEFKQAMLKCIGTYVRKEVRN